VFLGRSRVPHHNVLGFDVPVNDSTWCSFSGPVKDVKTLKSAVRQSDRSGGGKKMAWRLVENLPQGLSLDEAGDNACVTDFDRRGHALASVPPVANGCSQEFIFFTHRFSIRL
jgi:hypothetical protein